MDDCIFSCNFFLTKLFTEAWETGGESLIYLLIAFSIISGFLATHFTYVVSEKRYKKILKKRED